jgi:sialidase-1
MLVLTLFILCISVKLSLENDTVVFQKGEGGYYCVRIPSILTTAKGTLLAFGEARMYNCGDDTVKDIVYKRSTDNGKTWSTLQVLCKGNSTSDGYNIVGNFVPVQLKYNQRILIPFCKNNIILMQTYSDDDGVTFSRPEVISNVVKPEWKIVDLGPPSGLLLQSNRILIPGYYSTNASAGGSLSTGFVMLNDNNGEADKWYLGGQFNLLNYYPNEAQAVELLPNANSILINSRSYSTVRIGSYSDDGGLTFNRVKVLNTLVQPLHGCEGSMMYHHSSGQLFYSGLAETTMRTNLSLHVSTDNGENWTYRKTIWAGPSAYSSLTTLNDQSIGVLFEGGNSTPYDSLIFTIAYNGTEQKKFLMTH